MTRLPHAHRADEPRGWRLYLWLTLVAVAVLGLAWVWLVLLFASQGPPR